jgi:hypothetical protein
MITRELFGRILNMQQRGMRGEDTWRKFRINNLSQEKCTCQDGSQDNYITCVSVDDSNVITNLHPDYIERIFAGLEVSAKVEGMAIIDIVPDVPSPTDGKLKGPGIKPIKDSKKDRAYALFGRMYVNTGSKKAIIEAFQDQLSMTKAGAMTYYYNCAKDRI